MQFLYITLGVAIILSHFLFENWYRGQPSKTIINKYIDAQQQVHNFKIIKNSKTLNNRLEQKLAKHSL